jgi:hypothetical protein
MGSADEFGGGDTHVFGTEARVFSGGGGDEGATGQLVGPAEEAACALMAGPDGLVGNKGCFTPAMLIWWFR